MSESESDRVLQNLWRDVCDPVLTAARAQLSAAQQADLLLAQLLMVQTDPARVALFGFGEAGPINFGAYELTEAVGAAIASFFETGLNTALESSLRPIVLQLVESHRAQLVATLRPDRGTAVCTLVTRGDLHPPVELFRLQSTTQEIQH